MAAFGGGLEAFRLYGTVGVDTKPAQSGLEQLSGQVQKHGSLISTAMGTALGYLGGVAMQQVLGRGVGMLKGVAIDYNASMEQASIGFTTLLGSAEKAQSFIADLQKFAAVTPFDFPGLKDAANQMLAMGFTSKDVLPTLTAVGDATAALGLGSEAVGRATMALGQMRAAGRVNAQDMMQLTSMGIPAWQLLADSMGKTVPEVRALSEKGLIPAQKGIDAIVKGIEKGNMGGMMAAQAKTFTGAMSTISDSLMQGISTALKPFFTWLSSVAVAFSAWVSGDSGKAFFSALASSVGAVFRVLGDLFGLIGNVAGPMLGLLGSGVSTVLKGLKPLAPALDIVVGAFTTMLGAAERIVAAIVGVGQALFGVSEEWGSVGEALGNLGDAVLGYITTWLQTWPAALLQLGTAFVSWIAPMVPQVLTALGQLATGVMEWVTAQVPPLIAQLLTWAAAFVDWIGPQIPKFLDALMGFLEAGVNWIVNTGLPALVAGMLKLGAALVSWVAPRLPGLIASLASLMVGLVGWIVTQGVPRLLGAALKLGAGLVTGFINLITGKGGQPGLLASFVTFLTTGLIPGIMGLAGKLLDAGKNLAIQFGKGFANAVVGLLEGAINAVISGINSFQIHVHVGPVNIDWNGMQLPHIRLPRFATGVWEVPTVMPAILDPGEMVLPRTAAERFRQGVGGGAPTVVVNIREFRGTQQDVNDLTRTIARAIRLGTA